MARLHGRGWPRQGDGRSSSNPARPLPYFSSQEQKSESRAGRFDRPPHSRRASSRLGNVPAASVLSARSPRAAVWKEKPTRFSHAPCESGLAAARKSRPRASESSGFAREIEAAHSRCPRQTGVRSKITTRQRHDQGAALHILFKQRLDQPVQWAKIWSARVGVAKSEPGPDRRACFDAIGQRS